MAPPELPEPLPAACRSSELLEQDQRGDERALEELFERY
jgi:hypothetical protein